MKLIVGLGNPGPQYSHTRHNAGRIMLDQIMQQYGSKPRTLHKERNAMVGELNYEGQKIMTLKPLAYMNRSGAAIKSASHYYKIPVQNILVLHDEIDRAFGKIGLKIGGGHAGHNGLKDTIQHLGTNDFARIRIGVDRPTDKSQVVDYVLGKFSKEQMEWLHSDGYMLTNETLSQWLSKSG